MNEETPFCVNGCGKPAVAETPIGMSGENLVVELVCYECRWTEEQ